MSKRLDKGAKFICDRSGKTGYMRDAIVETGTGYLVLKSEVDKYPYDYVNHPQANLTKYAEFGGDPKPVPNARPDRSWVEPMEFEGEVNTGALADVIVFPSVLRPSSSIIASTASVTASGENFKLGVVNISSAASVSASGINVWLGTVNISSTASVTASADEVSFGSASIAAAATVTSTGTRTQYGVVNISSAASVTAAGNEAWLGSSSISASATVDSNAQVILVIENFEATPFTGSTLNWNEFPTDATGSTTRVTSNPTQGTYSWRLTGTLDAVDGIYQLSSDGAFDLTGFDSVKLDTYITDIGVTNARVFLYVEDLTSTNFFLVNTDNLGADTLTISLGGLPNQDNLNIAFGFYDRLSDGATTFDFTVDNLRAIR